MSGRVTRELRPHTTSDHQLQAQRRIYRQNRTPVLDSVGQWHALDVTPADADTTGRHLAEIAGRFGREGLETSVRGLAKTRGWSFAAQAVGRASPGSAALVRVSELGAASGKDQGTLRGACLGPEDPASGIVGGGGTNRGPLAESPPQRVGSQVASEIERSSPGNEIPKQVRSSFGWEGHRFDRIAIHADPAAHAAARMVTARAFTIGRSIYFGEGEYRPGTEAGLHLLAHEVAHAVQQGDASHLPTEALTVSDPSDAEEAEADRFARSTLDGDRPALPHAATTSAARLMRAITFARTNDAIITNDPGTAETATDFQIAQGAPASPHFQWSADVAIAGNAGDPFANFRVGPLQIVRDFWFNVFWGTGSNRTHRTSTVATPIRDATAGSTDWYADVLASTPFGANGDVRSTNIDDTPGVTGQPFANPVAGRIGTRGWFNWGMAFVSYISAKDTTAAAGAGYQHLGHVYWNMSLAGDFDTTRGAGAFVQVTSGGKTNKGKVIDGGSRGFPPMHGGNTFNTESNANLTTT